jgi:hypothetical protein
MRGGETHLLGTNPPRAWHKSVLPPFSHEIPPPHFTAALDAARPRCDEVSRNTTACRGLPRFVTRVLATFLGAAKTAELVRNVQEIANGARPIMS